MSKTIAFITGSRADFGKMDPLMQRVESSDSYDCKVFVTGMHTLEKYGATYKELEKKEYSDIYRYINQRDETEMDIVLSNTVLGFSNYVKEIDPDMIVIHGDRVEALAGAIVGSFNNILVSHIEGGEVSGTIDEPIRHSVTKLSHLHFVANKKAKKRVMQLGENESSIQVIGSPDIDVMMSDDIPPVEDVKQHYEIPFETYGILIYHPVTTKLDKLDENIEHIVSAVIASKRNYIVIHPNNDTGSDIILDEYQRLKNRDKFKIFPSTRFKYFLSLLKNSKFILGNSSAGIREAEIYAVPTINIGSRQKNRYNGESIVDVDHTVEEILHAIDQVEAMKIEQKKHFGDGDSCAQFMQALEEEDTWDRSYQKTFIDRLSV